MSTNQTPVLVLAWLLAACGSETGPGSGPGPQPSGPTALLVNLKNVNVIPGTSVELLTAAGAPKAYRIAGGSETTGPIALALGGADAQVSVLMDANEELRILPKRGSTEGTTKSCRRKGRTAGASAEVHVAELTEVRCVGAEWDAAEQPPASDCLTPVVLFDNFTTGSQWTATMTITTGSGPTNTVTNNGSGGNPGGYRHMTHSIPASSAMVVNHIYTGGNYNPSASGAIRRMHYSEDRLLFNPPNGAVGARFLITQGTGQFRIPLALNPANGGFSNTTWESIPLLRLTPASFSPATVNFSSTGGVINFGYQRSNTNSSVSGTAANGHGIDNWTVVICH